MGTEFEELLKSCNESREKEGRGTRVAEGFAFSRLGTPQKKKIMEEEKKKCLESK